MIMKHSYMKDDMCLYVTWLLLLYTDDTELLGESPDSVLKFTDAMHNYFIKWKLSVNRCF